MDFRTWGDEKFAYGKSSFSVQIIGDRDHMKRFFPPGRKKLSGEKKRRIFPLDFKAFSYEKTNISQNPGNPINPIGFLHKTIKFYLGRKVIN